MYVRFNDAVVADLVTPGHVKVQSTSNLAVVAQTLASSEYRRLPVIDDKGEVVHVITFTEVVNLLHQGLGSISSDFLSKKVSSLPHLKDALAKSETHDSKVDLFDVTGVVCVNEVAKTIEAFRLIIGTNVSAVPITNKENKLIGSVAVRDIRAIANNATDIRVLYDETTGEFIKRSIAPLDSLSVSLEEPLSAVIEKLYASRIHRVWVVRDGSIIGAVTLKDVLNEMVGHVQHPHH